MMKDFKQTTEQLKELAKVLNEFKSETVQVKLLELLFDQAVELTVPETTKKAGQKAVVAKPAPEQEAETTQATTTPKVPGRKPGRPPKQKAPQEPKPRVSRKRSTTRPGPSIILKQLIESNFFNDSRTIGDVVDYCMKMHNYEYKSTDLSGTLAKLAKDGILKREKNPKSNQFEYTIA